MDKKAKICPLCGKPNGCQAATDPQNCWCMTVAIPAGLLDSIPAEHKGTACICEDCVRQWLKNHH